MFLVGEGHVPSEPEGLSTTEWCRVVQSPPCIRAHLEWLHVVPVLTSQHRGVLVAAFAASLEQDA